MTYYIDPGRNALVDRVVGVAFPDYKGRKIRVEYGVSSVNVRSYWEGGSRTYWKLVRLADMQVLGMPTSHPVFDSVGKWVEDVKLEDGIVAVSHVIFLGEDLGVEIYVHGPASVLGPGDEVEITKDEAYVLASTGYKSSYGGIKDYRKYQCVHYWGMKVYEVDAARESLKEKGLLDKRGAITTRGKNALDKSGIKPG